MILAQTQAAYDGTAMVYGRYKAHSFLESPDPDGHAILFRLSLPTVLPSIPMRTTRLGPRAKSNTINFQPLALYLHQATRITRSAKDG
jgi:hypothetical protein